MMIMTMMMIRSDVQRLGPGERASGVTRGGARSDIDDELVIIQSERNCSTSPFLVSLSLKMLYYRSHAVRLTPIIYLSVSTQESRSKSKMFNSNKYHAQSLSKSFAITGVRMRLRPGQSLIPRP